MLLKCRRVNQECAPDWNRTLVLSIVPDGQSQILSASYVFYWVTCSKCYGCSQTFAVTKTATRT